MNEGVVALVDDLMIHVAAELRMRVQHYGDRRVFLPCRMIPALDPSGWAGEDDLGHLFEPRIKGLRQVLAADVSERA
jgi:hypothetical protein